MKIPFSPAGNCAWRGQYMEGGLPGPGMARSLYVGAGVLGPRFCFAGREIFKWDNGGAYYQQ